MKNRFTIPPSPERRKGFRARVLAIAALTLTVLLCSCAAESSTDAVGSTSENLPTSTESEEAETPEETGESADTEGGTGALDPYDYRGEDPIPSENLVTSEECLEAADNGEVRFIDVRTPATYSSMQFPWESLNIPVNQLSIREREFADEATLIVTATDNAEASRAFQAIVALGYPTEHVLVLNGGMNGWLMEGRDVEVPVLAYGC